MKPDECPSETGSALRIEGCDVATPCHRRHSGSVTNGSVLQPFGEMTCGDAAHSHSEALASDLAYYHNIDHYTVLQANPESDTGRQIIAATGAQAEQNCHQICIKFRYYF